MTSRFCFEHLPRKHWGTMNKEWILLEGKEDRELVLNICWVWGACETSKYRCEVDSWINGWEHKREVCVNGIDLVSFST